MIYLIQEYIYFRKVGGGGGDARPSFLKRFPAARATQTPKVQDLQTCNSGLDDSKVERAHAVAAKRARPGCDRTSLVITGKTLRRATCNGRRNQEALGPNASADMAMSCKGFS